MGSGSDAAIAAAHRHALYQSAFGLDPLLFLLTLTPLAFAVVVLYLRWRAYRRIRSIADNGLARFDKAAEVNEQAAARQQIMIQLLTEIRDRLPPPPPAAPDGGMAREL